MTDIHQLVLARIRAERKKGTPPTEVIVLIARILRRQKEADRALSVRSPTETKSGVA